MLYCEFVFKYKTTSVVVELSNFAVCGDFCVDVATLALVKVDLVLDLVDVCGLLLKLFLVHLPLFKRLLLFFIVFINEDSFIGSIKLLLLLLKLLAKFTNIVKVSCILTYCLGQITLSGLKITLSIFF
jgi:hypothetical protein